MNRLPISNSITAKMALAALAIVTSAIFTGCAADNQPEALDAESEVPMQMAEVLDRMKLLTDDLSGEEAAELLGLNADSFVFENASGESGSMWMNYLLKSDERYGVEITTGRYSFENPYDGQIGEVKAVRTENDGRKVLVPYWSTITGSGKLHFDPKPE